MLYLKTTEYPEDGQNLNSKCSKQKGEYFYLRTVCGEHKEAGSAGNCDAETKEEYALTAKTLFGYF